MDKIRSLRIQNTLLAAFGGVLLSFVVIFGVSMNGSLIAYDVILILIIFFWFVNSIFIYLIVKGYSERFSDPSLSLPQMYWASFSSLFTLLLIPDSSYLVYFLVFLIALFGVFCLRPSYFVFYALFQSMGLALVFRIQIHLDINAYQGVELLATWLVFSCCMLILIILCRSISLLRQKLRKNNAELYEALQSKRQFLANMSHEIRTPMNGVIGMLELLNKEELTLHQQRYLSVAKSSGEALIALINNVLDFSKIEAGKLDLDRSDFDIKSVLFNLSQSFYFLAHGKGLHFYLSIDPKIPSMIRADEIRIRQVINNLVGNALKFTQEGTISISASLIAESGTSCTLAFNVSDTGVGIDENAISKVFESFSQADSSMTRKFGGTGLGLAISQKLCGFMGGEILVESEIEKGSAFSFHIIVESILSAKPPGVLKGETILLIDSIEARVNALAENIRFLQGDTHIVASSSVALDVLLAEVADRKINTVIIHHSVNQNTGLTLARQLRNLPGLASTQYLVLVPERLEFGEEAKIYFLNDLYTLDTLYAGLENMNGEKDIDPSQLNCNTENELMRRGENVQMPFVLLVEDNTVNQEVAEMLLEDCGVKVVIAADGAHAIELLSSNDVHIQLVFMDCQMPVMDGYQATKAIRDGAAGERHKAIPIVAMTANALAGDRDRCIEVGMNDYISKPISFAALEDSVKKWISMS